MAEQTCPNCGKPYQIGDEVCRYCGLVFPFSTVVLPSGRLLQNRYEIQEMIHTGGMGYIYLAKDKKLYDRDVIIKQVREPIKDEKHRKKLEEEASSMARLANPNIAMLLDHFVEGGYYFLVVEQIVGKTLGEVYKEREGKFTEEEVLDWAITICEVAGYLHSKNVLHRDISPDNIMLTGKNILKFIDFGTSHEFRFYGTAGTVGIGKYGYTPPEQWRGKPEQRSDIFAIGATIYYLLTGYLPLSQEYLTGQAPQIGDYSPEYPPIRTKNPEISVGLEGVLQKALQLDIDKRYGSAAEFEKALRGLEKGKKKKPAVRRQIKVRLPKPAPFLKKKAVVFGITAVIIFVLGGLVIPWSLGVFSPGESGTTPSATTPAYTATPTTSHYTSTPTPTVMPTTAKDKITVGMVRSLTGSNSGLNELGFKPVYEIWVNEVNAAGGIYVEEYGKKLQIELRIYDDESDIDNVPQLTEKLILEDKVDFLWPACGDDMFLAQAPIANENNYILIAAESSTHSFRQVCPDMSYVFCSSSGSDWNQLPVLADLLAVNGCQSAFIVYIDDAHGNEYKSAAITEFGRVGIQILGIRSVTIDIVDLTDIINEAKASGADAFMCFIYPNHLINAIDLSIQLDYNPKAWLGGAGINFGFFNSIYGSSLEGVMGWCGYSRNSSPALAALADKLYTYWSNSEGNIDYWCAAFYWASLEMWKAAIEQAGTLDQTVIRDILATEHFQTILGDTWFDNGLLAKECHFGEVGQWINGIYEVVGHPDMATAPFIYPKPEWPEV